MSMIRWDPAGDLMTIKQSIDQLFAEVPRRSHFSMELGTREIPLDMYQTEDQIVTRAILPDIKPENVEISISGNVLTIKAEIKEDTQAKDRNYIYREHRVGKFSRSVEFPVPVQEDKADAVFENGVLTLTVPRAEHAKPRQIKIRVEKPKTP